MVAADGEGAAPFLLALADGGTRPAGGGVPLVPKLSFVSVAAVALRSVKTESS